MTDTHEDIRQRAVALTEVLLRINTFDSIELLVATMVLYLRCKPPVTEQDHADTHSLFRQAWKRYMAQKRERLYGPELEVDRVLAQPPKADPLRTMTKTEIVDAIADGIEKACAKQGVKCVRVDPYA